MYKNQAGYAMIFAWDSAAGAPKEGYSASITGYVSQDSGVPVQLGTPNPTEVSSSSAKGVYRFTLTAAETNADLITITTTTATSDVDIEPVFIYTVTDQTVNVSIPELTAGFSDLDGDRLHDYVLAMMSKTDRELSSDVDSFNVTTDSLEALRERLDSAAGSGFVTSTDSLQAIRDAIDTLLAPAVVGASSLSGSGFLSDCVTSIRQMVDEPSVSPKYTDADMVGHVTSAMNIVMSELHNNSDHNILCRFDITLVSGQLTYILPPNVGEIWAFRKMTTSTPVRPEWEAWPDNHWSAHRAGFVVENNELRLLTDWQSTDTLELLYVPNGESWMFKGTADSVTASTVVFPSSVTDGTLDTRANAYAGYLVRLLSDTTGYVQERTIDSYDNTTRTATLNTDWNPTPTGTIVIEVLPTYSYLIKDCVCLQAAMGILASEANTKRLQTIGQRYLIMMRTLRQMVAKKSSRFGSHAIGDTADNENRGGFFGWIP